MSFNRTNVKSLFILLITILISLTACSAPKKTGHHFKISSEEYDCHVTDQSGAFYKIHCKSFPETSLSEDVIVWKHKPTDCLCHDGIYLFRYCKVIESNMTTITISCDKKLKPKMKVKVKFR